jgi:hypothetical protein
MTAPRAAADRSARVASDDAGFYIRESVNIAFTAASA